MQREKMIGNYCVKCEYVMKRGRADCGCMTRMDEKQATRHRDLHWLPAWVTLETSMERANR